MPFSEKSFLGSKGRERCWGVGKGKGKVGVSYISKNLKKIYLDLVGVWAL